MTTFVVTDPNGKEFEVNAPEGTTQEQALAYAQQQFQENAPQTSVKPDDTMGEIRNMLEGLTLGFADELGLGAAAGAAAMTTGDNYFDVYKNMRDQYNREQAAYAKSRPVYSTAANIMGGLATGGLGAGKVMATPLARANPIKTSMLLGAGTGATAGAGFAPTIEDIPIYSGVGAISGAALPLGFSLLGKVASPIANMMQKGATLEQPRTSAAKTISNFLEKDLMSLEGIKSGLTRMGGQATLADIGGENVKGLARAAATLQGTGKTAAKEMFRERQRGSTGRLMGTLKKLSGGDENYFQNMQKIIESNKINATPFYKEAEKQSVSVTDDLANLLNRPSLKQAMKKGARKAMDEGRKIPKEIKAGDTIDFRTFDYTKRALDDKIGAAVRQGNKDEARVLINLKNEILDIADEQIPAYAKARSIYSEGASNQNAMELGTRILKDDFDEMADVVGKMSKGEKDAFVNGALKTVRNKLMTGREDKNAATKLASQAVRERLRTAFDDEATYQKFINQVDIEDEFAGTFQSVFGGSPTQPRQIGQKEMYQAYRGESPLDEANVYSAIRKAIGNEDIPQPVVDEIQAIMFKPVKSYTSKDWKLLQKYDLNSAKLSNIKGTLPASLTTGMETGAGEYFSK